MPASRTRPESIYAVHPSIAMFQNWVETLSEKTGRSLEQWIAYVKKEGPTTEKERREWLKAKHKLGANTAWWIAEQAGGNAMGMADDDPDSYLAAAPKMVDDMYAGKKAGLRPIHDKLIQLARKLGKDVKICPCKTIVPFYRRHVFAEIKPATLTRIDFGLALGPLLKEGKREIPARLIDTGGFKKKDRITHRILLTSAKEIDDEVRRWVEIAYDLDA